MFSIDNFEISEWNFPAQMIENIEIECALSKRVNLVLNACVILSQIAFKKQIHLAYSRRLDMQHEGNNSIYLTALVVLSKS